MNFTPFQRVAPLSSECVITEKIDGVQVSVWIYPADYSKIKRYEWPFISGDFVVRAASRNRFLTSDHFNFGFAAWVRDHAEELVKLGPGVHYGEWWGRGIRRGYGLDERRFSLFNTGRWFSYDWPECDDVAPDGYQRAPSCCHMVPVLWRGKFCTTEPQHRTPIHELVMEKLRWKGSQAADGFMNPEGIVVQHMASGQLFSKTRSDDDG